MPAHYKQSYFSPTHIILKCETASQLMYQLRDIIKFKRTKTVQNINCISEELANKTVTLLEIKDDIMDRYPSLEDENMMENVTKALDLLCYIQTYPRHRWSFWAAFDFCVSVITTVGEIILHKHREKEATGGKMC